MSDLISRKAAIDALGEEPMVWTENDDYALGERNQWRIDKLSIEAVPSSQPEIIRCKDCKWLDITSPASTMTLTFYKCRCFEKHYTQEDEFCSKGART